MKGDREAALQLAKDELGILCDDDPSEIVSFEEAVAVPRIKHMAGLIRFWWDAEQIQVAVTRLHAHTDGRVTGELKISTSAPGYQPHLHQSQLNFTAVRSKQEVAKFLGTRMNDVDWNNVIETVSQHAIERVRQGEPVLELWTCDDVKPPSYALTPFLPEDQPTVLYGLGGTGKSMFALACSLIVNRPWPQNPLEFLTVDRFPGLYLDWETSENELRWRMSCLQKGMMKSLNEHISLLYRRCALPLADDTERIRQTILDKGIKFVVIDSIGAACGGDLNSAEPAIRMFTALRELRVTSLLLAHTAKNSNGRDSTIFGSSFFNFYARNVWEMKKAQETNENIISVGLYHRKANISKLHPSLGFKITFDDDSTHIARTDLRKIAQMRENLSQPEHVEAVLMEGARSLGELEEITGIGKASLNVVLGRLIKKGLITRMGETYGWVTKREYDG